MGLKVTIDITRKSSAPSVSPPVAEPVAEIIEKIVEEPVAEEIINTTAPTSIFFDVAEVVENITVADVVQAGVDAINEALAEVTAVTGTSTEIPEEDIFTLTAPPSLSPPDVEDVLDAIDEVLPPAGAEGD